MSSKGAQWRWIAGLALAAGVVVIALAFTLGHEPPALASTANPAATTSQPTIASIDAPALLGPGEASAPEPELAPDDRSPAVAPSASVASDEAPRFVLRGRIESSRHDLERAEVDVSRARNTGGGHVFRVERADSNRVAVEADGRFEVDVTALVQRGDQLTVTGRHPALKTAVASVSTTLLERAKPGELVELSVTLVMNEAMCRLRGRVVTENDEALSSSVAAFELRDGALVAAAPNAGAETKKHGAFELELSPVPHVLVAYARDWRPATVHVACACGATLELSPIVLDRGFAISGQALLGSAPFAAGMIVTADIERPVSLVSADNASFAWTGERFEWQRRQARANELGLYEITALGNRPYSVRMLGAGDPGTLILDAQSFSVLAPASDVELTPGMCELRVVVLRAGAPAAVHFTIHETIGRFSQRYSEGDTNVNGRATMWVAPNHVTELIVDRGEPNERVFNVPTCAANTGVDLRIDL